jgi:hypothetical protein
LNRTGPDWESLDYGGLERTQAWTNLVRECARASGRNMSNIKVYIGKAVTLRQIDAVTERGADEVLQLCQKPVVSQADKARVEYLVLQAKDKLLSKDSGGKAAFSAIATFVGLRCALYLAYRRAGVGTC